jgi:type I restriction enzyme M protein
VVRNERCRSTSRGIWHTLRHDGIDYGSYIEHLTYLLFLKMADELGVELAKGCDWPGLVGKSDTVLQDHYVGLLRKLGEQRGVLGSVFSPCSADIRQFGQPQKASQPN